jgi:Zn-finger nucleic acid-binding protein
MRCPADGSTLDVQRDGDLQFGICPRCGGAWVPGRETRALLEGELTLPETALRDARRHRVPLPPPEDTPRLAHTPAHGIAESPVLRIVCSDCRARLRSTDVASVAACTRCGALWIPGGETSAIADWYDHALQVRAAMALQPTRVRYGQWRDVDVHGDFERMIIVLVAAFAFFVVLGPLTGGYGRLATRLRAFLLAAGGVGLVFYGFQFPSRENPGALSRRGFAWALAGVVIGVLAIFDWS